MSTFSINNSSIGLSVLVASMLAACGGGGGDSGSNNGNGQITPSSDLTMSCVDGPNYQCSGGTVLAVDNGVTLTNSGVQVYGRSTSDLAASNPDKTNAFGLALASGGVVEARIEKRNDGAVSKVALLMRNLGLSWDGRVERPQTIETFDPTQGRTVLASNGALTSVPLPPSSDLSFYDYASRGVNATQANYANNRYFPRSEPSRCGAAQNPCMTTETDGVRYQQGNWRTGGTAFDLSEAIRAHSDGDIHSGNAQPGPNGEVRWLEGGSGVGVPHPGSKGYRMVRNWSLQYSNLANWFTHDTVLIAEWGGGDEHNKNRRGSVVFGAVTDPASIPTSGTATYSGTAYGWYTPNSSQDPSSFTGAATVTVNFSTRQATIVVNNAVIEGSQTPVPVAINAVASIDPNRRNYFTGPVSTGTLSGGVSGRYFGQVGSAGSGGNGPAEVGGTFSLSNAAGATGLGGFIARKQ